MTSFGNELEEWYIQELIAQQEAAKNDGKTKSTALVVQASAGNSLTEEDKKRLVAYKARIHAHGNPGTVEHMVDPRQLGWGNYRKNAMIIEEVNADSQGMRVLNRHMREKRHEKQ